MAFFDQKKLAGEAQAAKQARDSAQAAKEQEKRNYAAFVKALTPQLDQALAEFPQAAKQVGLRLAKEDQSYFHLRRSGWGIGTFWERLDGTGLRSDRELYVAPNGSIYMRTRSGSYLSDEMEKIDRKRAYKIMLDAFWERAKEPAPGTYDPKKIVETHFYGILGIK